MQRLKTESFTPVLGGSIAGSQGGELPEPQMTSQQDALLKQLAHDAYDLQAYRPSLTRSEAERRIATLQAKLKLQGSPPHTQ